MERGIRSGWKKLLLRDICERVDYGYTASANKKPVGPKFLRITDIVPDLIDWTSVPYCKIKDNDFDKYRLNKGDIVIARTGATTGFAKLIKADHHSVFASYLVRIRINSEHDNRFIGQIVESNEYKRFIKANIGGAAQPQANARVLTSFPLLVPPLPIQHKIAAILSAYDDLIENNTRRIKILEDMAQLIYREWFVNFRFLGHEKVKMVESELGPIPEGWEVRRLDQFGKVITGKTPSKKVATYFGGEIPFIKPPDLQKGLFCVQTSDSLSTSGAASQKNKMLPLNTLCVSCIGTPGLVAITTTNSQTNQQINSIVLNHPNLREFLYFTLSDMKPVIEQYAATGATMPNLSKGKFESLRVIYPTEDVIAAFHNLVSPMFNQIRSLLFKNANLRRTRDLLLPKLVSGEVDVSDLDINVEGTGVE